MSLKRQKPVFIHSWGNFPTNHHALDIKQVFYYNIITIKVVAQKNDSLLLSVIQWRIVSNSSAVGSSFDQSILTSTCRHTPTQCWLYRGQNDRTALKTPLLSSCVPTNCRIDPATEKQSPEINQQHGFDLAQPHSNSWRMARRMRRFYGGQRFLKFII